MNWKKIIIGILILLVLIQFFRINKTNPEFNHEKDYLTSVETPENISNMLKNACYDCHSYETNYPWYSNVAPISWMLKSHVNEGRHHVNFSLWGDFDSENKSAIKHEIVEVLEEGEMPLASYTRMHPEAKLTNDQKETLINWFDSKTENHEKDDEDTE